MRNCLTSFLLKKHVFFQIIVIASYWNASWISQWKHVKYLLLQCDINFLAGGTGIRTNKAQGNRMEKKMGTRLALCFEDKITSLNLIQDFPHADMNFKIQKRFLKLPFAPKVGGLYLLHHFHSISTRPPKLDSLKGWPPKQKQALPGLLVTRAPEFGPILQQVDGAVTIPWSKLPWIRGSFFVSQSQALHWEILRILQFSITSRKETAHILPPPPNSSSHHGKVLRLWLFLVRYMQRQRHANDWFVCVSAVRVRLFKGVFSSNLETFAGFTTQNQIKESGQNRKTRNPAANSIDLQKAHAETGCKGSVVFWWAESNKSRDKCN